MISKSAIIYPNVKFGKNCIIEDFVIIGVSQKGYKAKELKGPHIMKCAIIGAHSTLQPGVKIGEHSLIGAGSVVTRDVPDRCVFAGNPAKQINRIENLPYEI